MFYAQKPANVWVNHCLSDLCTDCCFLFFLFSSKKEIKSAGTENVSRLCIYKFTRFYIVRTFLEDKHKHRRVVSWQQALQNLQSGVYILSEHERAWTCVQLTGVFAVGKCAAADSESIGTQWIDRSGLLLSRLLHLILHVQKTWLPWKHCIQERGCNPLGSSTALARVCVCVCEMDKGTQTDPSEWGGGRGIKGGGRHFCKAWLE